MHQQTMTVVVKEKGLEVSVYCERVDRQYDNGKLPSC